MSEATRALTVSIPVGVHRELKQLAAERETTMRQLITTAIKLVLPSDSDPNPPQKPTPSVR